MFRAGHTDTWVRWFADAVIAAAARSGRPRLAAAVAGSWLDAVADLLVDSAARELILAAQPGVCGDRC